MDTINVKLNTQQKYKVSGISYGAGTNRLSELKDVSIVNPIQNDTIIFNASTNKFESKQITQDIMPILNIDAGIF